MFLWQTTEESGIVYTPDGDRFDEYPFSKTFGYGVVAVWFCGSVGLGAKMYFFSEEFTKSRMTKWILNGVREVHMCIGEAAPTVTKYNQVHDHNGDSVSIEEYTGEAAPRRLSTTSVNLVRRFSPSRHRAIFP
jgi:hypothetical protein